MRVGDIFAGDPVETMSSAKISPMDTRRVKISDCGMVLEEQPNKVSEALRLFLQGLGYAIQVGRKKLSSSVSTEGLMVKLSSSGESLHSASWPIRITENPISEAAVC